MFWCDTVRVGAGVELDDEWVVGAEVDDLAHDAGGRRSPSVADARRPGRASDLLGPDDERPGRAEQLRGRRRRSSRLEVPTKPATNALAGLLVELDRGRRAARCGPR